MTTARGAISTAGPFEALEDFLSAGTLSFALSVDVPWEHRCAQDGWHIFPGHTVLETRLAASDPFILLLDFLIHHHFIAATCLISPAKILYVRIYLIPFDLANVQGRLRTRNEKVLSRSRVYLKSLLSRVLQDDDKWDGQQTVSSSKPQPLLMEIIDNRTMAEIYGDLPSPIAIPQYYSQEVPGMRSVLYPYQARSVSVMMAREMHKHSAPDPLYLPIVGIDGRTFYLQPTTMEVLRECPRVEQAHGGILCEELGTGKTVMMLALILATLDQLPEPEEDPFENRPVMTPLSFRYFSTAECRAARKRIAEGSRKRRKRAASDLDSPQIPSLVEMLLHQCRVEPAKLKLHTFQESLENRGLWNILMHNTPFYHHYSTPQEALRSRRGQTDTGPKTMYLSSATLIVVPDNLLAQWVSEITKHCHDTLRILEVRTKTLPRASVLASQYDIVLMTHLRFSSEEKHGKTPPLFSWEMCICPGYAGTRVPRCRCSHPDEVSPLLQIRWKRLITDEGHIAGTSRTTSFSSLIKMISVERKWIVTGTPTTNLLGLGFGRGSELQYPEDTMGDPTDPYSLDGDIEEDDRVARRWTSTDRGDLTKLSTMITHFLEIPQFVTQTGLFDAHVVQPLLDASGPRPGAIQVLMQLMSTHMVRHRIEDIEKDVLLPFVKQDTVLLDLDPYALKTYNIMQAVIAVNAIDSQRVDQDYLFHALSVAALQELVENVSQSLFWHVDPDGLFNLKEIVSNAKTFLQTAQERDTSVQDVDLMQQSLMHAHSALNDPVWVALQAQPYVHHRIYNMPPPISYALSRLTANAAHASAAFVDPDRLVSLRSFVRRQPLAHRDRIVRFVQDVVEEERQRVAFNLSRLRPAKRIRRGKRTQRKELEAVRSKQSPEKQEEMRRELLAAEARLRASLEEDDRNNHSSESHSFRGISTGTPQYTAATQLLSSSPVGKVRIGNSTSSKLDYILEEIRRYSPTEKFLIFSKSPLTLQYVAEGLALVEVKFLLAIRVSATMREQMVTTFETSDLFRVFLLELKHGARGLNLVAASRVIFCEPVWQADVETQAIKRVHRIGQKRPVTVKTLAIRDTEEEVMVTRREALKSSAQKQPKLTDDRRMRDFIQNPTFLQPASAAPLVLDFALFGEQDASQPSMVGTPAESGSAVQIEMMAAPEHVVEPSRKKGKGVHFATYV